MRAIFFVAESATTHADGTTSVLRAWIDQITTNGVPVNFSCAIVARIKPEDSEVGQHGFTIQARQPSGALALELSGEFRVDVVGKAASVAAAVEFLLTESGQTDLVLAVDGVDIERWPLQVITATP